MYRRVPGASCAYLLSILTFPLVLLSGQLLKDIPASVLSEVVMHLNNPSPLRNNWKAVAAELLLSFQTVQSLDHHAPGGMMEGVLQIMFQRKMTVRDLANMLEEIQRPDIVEILVKAGLPENNIRQEKTNGMLKSYWIDASSSVMWYTKAGIFCKSHFPSKESHFLFVVGLFLSQGVLKLPQFIRSFFFVRCGTRPTSLSAKLVKLVRHRVSSWACGLFVIIIEQNDSIFRYTLFSKNQNKIYYRAKVAETMNISLVVA